MRRSNVEKKKKKKNAEKGKKKKYFSLSLFELLMPSGGRRACVQ